MVKLLISVLGCLLVGALGGLVTAPGIQDWYQFINKPSFTPPNWVFGPAWMILYLLMGIAFFLVWKKGLKERSARGALAIFGVQLFLNFLWSVL